MCPKDVSDALGNLSIDMVKCENEWYSVVQMQHAIGKNDQRAKEEATLRLF